MSKQPINLQKVILQQDSIDLQKAVYQLKQSWYLFIIFPLLTLGAAGLYLYYSTPVYEVKGLILLESDQNSTLNSEVFSRHLNGFGLASSPDLNDEIKILKSRTIMRRVIDSLNLNYTIWQKGKVRDLDQYGRHPFTLDSFNFEMVEYSGELPEFEIELLSNTNFTLSYEGAEFQGQLGQRLETDYGQFWFSSAKNEERRHFYNNNRLPHQFEDKEKIYLLKIHDPLNVVLNYLKKLSIEYESGSKVMTLSMKDEVPQRSIDMLNHIIYAYNAEGIKDQNEVGQNTLSFIDERLLILSEELGEVEQDVEMYKTKEGITIDASSDLQFLLGKVSEYDKELTQLNIRQSILNYLYEYVSKDSAQFELIPSNLDVSNSALTQLLLELNNKQQRRKRLLQTVTDDYLEVTALNNDIANLRFNILENIKNILRDIEIAIAQVNARSLKVEQQLKKTPRRERELVEIKRQQFIKENLYLFLLEKREETAIALAAATSKAKIIDRPELMDIQPISPKRIQTLLGALFLGVFIPFGTIIFQNIFKDTIESEEDIREITQAPILGTLAENKKDSKIVVELGAHSALAEMFRLLRTNIQFINPGHKHLSILMTSSVSGEGKSFVAVNLALSFALSAKRVLLIGLDLRKPTMSSYLQISDDTSAKGISNYLAGQADKKEIVRQYEKNEKLCYIASGPLPPNPSELIMNGKLQPLITELKNEFDVIIIDSPPVGLVTDSLLLKDIVNTTIFITRYGITKKEHLSLLDRLYQEQKLVNPAIVLTGVKQKHKYGYGYYK